MQMTTTLRPTHKDDADLDLVLKAKQGDSDAFDILINRHYGLVYAIALSRLKNREAAEDLVQEVFLRIYLNLNQLKDEKKFMAWLTRMTRNLAMDWMRRNVSRSALLKMLPMEEALHDLPDEATKSPREAAHDKRESEKLMSIIWELPEKQRELVLMHFQEEIPKRTIAQSLGVHPSTIGRQLEQALSTMKDQFENRVERTLKKQRSTRRAVKKTVAVIAMTSALTPEAKAAIISSAVKSSGTSSVALEASTSGGLFTLIQGFVSSGVQSMATATGIKIASNIVLAGGIVAGTYIYQHSDTLFLDREAEYARLFEEGQIFEGLNQNEMQGITFEIGKPFEGIIPRGDLVKISYPGNLCEDCEILVHAEEDGTFTTAVLNKQGDMMIENLLRDSDRVFFEDTYDAGTSEFIYAQKEENGVKIYHQIKESPEFAQIYPEIRSSYDSGEASIDTVVDKALEEARRSGLYPDKTEYQEYYEKAMRKRIKEERFRTVEQIKAMKRD